MNDLVDIRRALVSCSEKNGLDTLCRSLHERGVTILSTGGTARFIEEIGVPVTRVEDVTGFPEMLDGRVKTLHPAVHGGLLAVGGNAAHESALVEHGIEAIDLLVVNLYPFAETAERLLTGAMDGGPEGLLAHEGELIEQIDIGGPAMLRSASKNFDRVAVLSDPEQYDEFLDVLDEHEGATPRHYRRSLAVEVFEQTAAYDAAIAACLGAMEQMSAVADLDETERAAWDNRDADADTDADGNEGDIDARFFQAEMLTHELVSPLRYGENPHQMAAVYANVDTDGPSIVEAEQRSGKPLSYNNLLDASAALALALDLGALENKRVGAAVIKHTNPCGAATAGTVRDAVAGALAGDPLAAFGGILAVSEPIDKAAAKLIVEQATFFEVVIAPDFDGKAEQLLAERWANLRLLATGSAHLGAVPERPLTFRSILGGMLVQEADACPVDPDAWTLAAGEAPDAHTHSASAVLWTIVKHLSSNAIAIGGPDESIGAGVVRLFGAGAGQMDRVASCRLAVEKAGERAAGAIAASDAFFPFPDGPGTLIDAGVRTIVQPGGSKRDQETFDLCAKRGVACLTTGMRHFRH